METNINKIHVLTENNLHRRERRNIFSVTNGSAMAERPRDESAILRE